MTLVIDGQEVEARGSLLDAIIALDMDVPHLCKDDNLPAIGACRTCLVEADGRVVAACSIPAASVAHVSTTSDRAARLRRGVLELTAAMCARGDGVAGGPRSHEARDAMKREGVESDRFAQRTAATIDESNPFFSFHEDECILCARCVTACQQLQHISAIGMAGHGIGTLVTPGAGVAFLDSICTSCGSCVAACPTTALRPKHGGI